MDSAHTPDQGADSRQPGPYAWSGHGFSATRSTSLIRARISEKDGGRVRIGSEQQQSPVLSLNGGRNPEWRPCQRLTEEDRRYELRSAPWRAFEEQRRLIHWIIGENGRTSADPAVEGAFPQYAVRSTGRALEDAETSPDPPGTGHVPSETPSDPKCPGQVAQRSKSPCRRPHRVTDRAAGRGAQTKHRAGPGEHHLHQRHHGRAQGGAADPCQLPGQRPRPGAPDASRRRAPALGTADPPRLRADGRPAGTAGQVQDLFDLK